MERNGKVVFITGSASNNGRVMALWFARRGYDIAIHHSGRSAENAQSVKKELDALGVRSEIFSEDLSVSGAADRLFAAFREKFDRLDIFVNNAGVTKMSNISVTTEEEFDRVFAIDCRAAMFCVRNACEFMREKGIAGSAVVISSNHHDRLWRNHHVYGSSKEAICRFVEYAAVEYIRYGIRVNCLAPGWIDWEEAGEQNPEEMKQICDTEIPAHRFVKSSELAAWTEFLAGDFGKSLVGRTIDLDGGASLLSDSMAAYGLDTSGENDK